MSYPSPGKEPSSRTEFPAGAEPISGPEIVAALWLLAKGYRILGFRLRTPLGEIDLILPMDGAATFDDRAAGWLVCPAGSAHRPTVAAGRALVLYLLPEGRIEFTR